ncbi:MAG TPA: DUF481 domain-containing protein [Myxococcales bacterium]|jgi:hypothetical protein
MMSLAVAALVSQLLAAAAPAPAPAASAAAAEDAARSAAAAAAAAEKSSAAIERSAAAVEKAADAAMKAAEAAQRAAEAAAGAASKAAAPAPAPAPAPAQVAAPGPIDAPAPGAPAPAVWTGSTAVSLVSLSGNSESIAVTLNAAAERKSENWILGLKAAGSYGEAKAAVGGAGGAWAINALNATVQARAAFRFTPRYSAYLVLGIDTDHVASVEERPFGEAGIGILWLDEMEGDLSKLKLNTDIAFRYAKEMRFQYYPVKTNIDDVDFAAPRIGLAFRYALNKNVIFTEDAEVLPNVIGDARWLVNSNTKIAARVVNPLSIYISLLVKYDSRPAVGKVDTDTALAFGVEAGF